MSGWRRSMQRYTRRSELTLVGALREQVSHARDGLRVARRSVTGDLKGPKARRKIATIEHRGDDERAQLIQVLYRQFAIPIDREDLFRVSRSIDDVLDDLRDFVREYDMFGLGPQPQLDGILAAVDKGLVSLDGALEALVHEPKKVRAAALAAKKAPVRTRYQEALRDVLERPVDQEMLKLQAVLRRLDGVGLRLAEAANALADGAMKRSY